MERDEILPVGERDLEGLNIVELSEEEHGMVARYLAVIRDYEEARRLYRLFRFHLEALTETYEFTNGDRFLCHVPPLLDFTDQERINALVISFISAGKTLTDALLACIQSAYGKDSDETTAFEKALSREYDGSFSYRLLLRLRDFAQHGYLPVRVDGNRVCFDIAQILNVPHFQHNKALRQQMEDFAEELFVEKQQPARHVFTLAMAEYAAVLARIYRDFWTALEPAFAENSRQFFLWLGEHPGYLEHRGHPLDGCLCFQVGTMLHVIPGEDHPEQHFAELRLESRTFCSKMEEELEGLRSCSRFVPF